MCFSKGFNSSLMAFVQPQPIAIAVCQKLSLMNLYARYGILKFEGCLLSWACSLLLLVVGCWLLDPFSHVPPCFKLGTVLESVFHPYLAQMSMVDTATLVLWNDMFSLCQCMAKMSKLMSFHWSSLWCFHSSLCMGALEPKKMCSLGSK